MSCDFNCLDVNIFRAVNEYYSDQTVDTALKKIDIETLLPHKIIMTMNDLSNSNNIVKLYIPLLTYLNKSYHLLWSSIIIWDLLIDDYYFRTVKTDYVLNSKFDAIHEFANEKYYKEQILSLTDIIFGKSNISKPVILSKSLVRKENNFIVLNICKITDLIMKKLNYQNSFDDIETLINTLCQDKELIQSIYNLNIPQELSIIKDQRSMFLKYLVWLQVLDDQWVHYYYLPTSFIAKETGGQTIAVKKELDSRDITKIMIINGIIHEPISRQLNEQLRVKEVESKINLLEQTYHDITRRYLNIFENIDETEKVADLLRSKIDYLMRLARSDKQAITGNIDINVKNGIDDLFNLLDYDLKEYFELDKESLNTIKDIKINTYPGAFRTLFENLIGNTCKHAWNRSIVNIFIRCNENNNGIIYKDNGQGFPKAMDGIGILDKIENCWFKNIFSNEDIAQRKDKGTIRGMGLYIVKQAAEFLNWNIIPKAGKEVSEDRVQIEYHISWE